VTASEPVKANATADAGDEEPKKTGLFSNTTISALLKSSKDENELV
jgi:hypothetical protein